MAEPALSRMTLEEFLRWESGDDKHYELIAGRPVAMNPPASAHRTIVGRLAHRIAEALASRRSCRVEVEVGVRLSDDDYTYYQADLAVTCAPHRFKQQAIEDPILIVEVLSPGSEEADRKLKLPDYRSIATVQEILLVDSEIPYAEVHRRLPNGTWLTDILRGMEGRLQLASVAFDLAMGTLYEDLELRELRSLG